MTAYETLVLNFISNVNKGVELLNDNLIWPVILADKPCDEVGVNTIVVGDFNTQIQIMGLLRFNNNISDLIINFRDSKTNLIQHTFKKDHTPTLTNEALTKEVFVYNIDINKNFLLGSFDKHLTTGSENGKFYFSSELAPILITYNGKTVRLNVRPYRKQVSIKKDNPTSYQVDGIA